MGQAVAVDDIGLSDRVPKDVARHVHAEANMIVLVTGGRNFSDVVKLNDALVSAEPTPSLPPTTTT
jgi:hypothetical protein